MLVRGPATEEMLKARATENGTTLRLVCSCGHEAFNMVMRKFNAAPITNKKLMAMEAKKHGRDCNGKWTLHMGDIAESLGRVEW